MNKKNKPYVTGTVTAKYTDGDPWKIVVNGNYYSAFEEKHEEIDKCDEGDKVKVFYKRSGDQDQFRNVVLIEKLKQTEEEIDKRTKKTALTCTASVFKGCGNETDPDKLEEVYQTFLDLSE